MESSTRSEAGDLLSPSQHEQRERKTTFQLERCDELPDGVGQDTLRRSPLELSGARSDHSGREGEPSKVTPKNGHPLLKALPDEGTREAQVQGQAVLGASSP